MKRSGLYFVFILSAFLSEGQDFKFERKTMTYADTLGLDLFVPKKSGEPMPLLVYVHGGGFSGGKRDLPNHLNFCERFAKKGWVTATISYHLTMKGKSFGCDQPVQNKINTFRKSAENIHQAVAFLMKQKVNIDTTQIVIAGSSAGAEAVIQAAYWPETKRGILPASFKYAGVISMAGALLDINWITAETAIPTALFHGTCDNLVPYGTASHHYCRAENDGYMMLFGSASIADRLESLGKSYYLLSDCGGGHEWNEWPIRPEHVHMIEDFLEFDVLKQKERQTRVVYHMGKRDCKLDLCE